jgi:DNA-binding MarR family transcriptional regulator
MVDDFDRERPGQAGRQRAAEIRHFILESLAPDAFSDVTRATVARFQVTRQAVHKQLKRLETKGLIEGRGRTKNREHKLAVTSSHRRLRVAGLQEDKLYHEFAEPSLRDLPEHVQAICYYGFTEMVNNVIDHSSSEMVAVKIERTANSVTFAIHDFGVGVFRKIQQALELPSLQEALFELTKGKVTTDPTRHTGEGLFYTSRAFDRFRLLSGGLFLTHDRTDDDWLLGSDDESKNGTSVFMTIDARSTHTLTEVFDYYASERDDYAFSKTNVVLRLLDSGDESFVSRSQAKRVLARLPRFKEVLLDFEGVSAIGPAFADQIFRVFAAEHPDVHVTPIRANDEVIKMIDRARKAAVEDREGSS